MIFSLDEPLILTGKKESSCEGKNVQYIPYTTDERESADEGATGNGYPESWKRRIGMLSYFKGQRENKINRITEDDIRQEGIRAVNPLIGELPSRQELREEMERLLMSM